MNTNQIQKALSRNPHSRSYFLGCYAADRIPLCYEFPYCLVVNTESSHYRGEHWLAIWVESPRCIEYYDSFGLWPPPLLITQFLVNFPTTKRNTILLQSPFSRCCGHHALYFILQRSLGRTFTQIIEHLRQSQKPDSTAYSYVRYHFDI
jgi:hypothetical protein